MGYNNGGYSGGNRPKFEPKPGSGSLFPKQQKKSQNDPDWDGYFIADRAIQAGEKIKLVGWDKSSNQGSFITLKPGREQQPQQGGYQGQQGQGGYQQPQQGGYRQAPSQQYQNPNGNFNQGGYSQPPQQGYSNPNPTYGAPNQALPLQPGFPPAGQARGYVPPATQQPQGQYVPPGPNGNQAPPPDHEDLPF